MNDYEMMEQRVDQLRLELSRLNQKKNNIQSLIDDVMAELLDTRRQITRADRQRVKLGFFLENCQDRASFEKELAKTMATLSAGNSDPVVRQIDGVYMATWMGHPIT